MDSTVRQPDSVGKGGSPVAAFFKKLSPKHGKPKPDKTQMLVNVLPTRHNIKVQPITVNPKEEKNCNWKQAPSVTCNTPPEEDLSNPEGIPGFVISNKIHFEQWKVAEIQSLGAVFQSVNIYNTMQSGLNGTGKEYYNNLVENEDEAVVVHKLASNKICKLFIRAGPRKFCHFDPKNVRAAVVTCGGLCPGLNNVIREIVLSLYHLYGCSEVIGIRGGFNGFHDPNLQPVLLNPKTVEAVHHHGGTFLGSSRGGHDLEKIINFIIQNDVNQLYIIGGDGTHRGAHKVSTECMRRGLNVAVVGIPKTIDNDVGLIDRSFGFQSAVEAAQVAIRSAKVEAQCNIPRGVGVVKLMGRSSGFIAAFATLSSNDVDLCLVPEVPIVMDGDEGILAHLQRVILEKGHAVVVVAEGAGEELLGKSAETDAGGNRKLPQIGEWIKKEIEKYFAAQGTPATVKYIDPSYMIRSVPANAEDSYYCGMLARNAVHGAMAGFTGFSVGMSNNEMVYIPIPLLTSNSPRLMDVNGRSWEQVISLTRQPNKLPASFVIDAALEQEENVALLETLRVH